MKSSPAETGDADISTCQRLEKDMRMPLYEYR